MTSNDELQDINMYNGQLVDVVLFAEFDIDKGSTLRASYPHAIEEYSSEYFADVMLPEGVHHHQIDSTIFFLNHAKQDINEYKDHTGEMKKKEIYYCLNVVKTTHDTNVRRGAHVKAIAICSRHKFGLSLQSVVERAVDKLVTIKSTNVQDTNTILKEVYQVINEIHIDPIRISLSGVQLRLAKRYQLKCILAKQRHYAVPYGEQIIGEKSPLRLDSTKFKTNAIYNAKTNNEIMIPLEFERSYALEEFESGSLISLLQIFKEQTMILYNAVISGQRILIMGDHHRHAREICDLVLATSGLVCPPLNGTLCRLYPYANLTDLDFLKTPGYIAGVNNPMFQTKKDWWDVLADVSNSRIIEMTSRDSGKNDSDGGNIEAEEADRLFIAEVLEGILAGFPEVWVRAQFEQYTRKNITNIASGYTSAMTMNTQVQLTALNNRRITQWARTTTFHCLKGLDAPETSAFNPQKTNGVDLKRHIMTLQGDRTGLDDTVIEGVYGDLVKYLVTEDQLLEFLSLLPANGGLQQFAIGLFHTSLSVKFNTVLLLKRLESYPKTSNSLSELNSFLLMSYERIHQLVHPDTKAEE